MNKNQLIETLYKINAIKLGDFVLKSGQASPIYLDLRQIISYPFALQAVVNTLWQSIQFCQFDKLCGVPYTALPIATGISLQHNIPMIMRRKEKKSYGTKQKVEGSFNVGETCLLIEDVITTGSSILETADDIEETGFIIKDIAVLIDREQGGKEILQRKRYTVHAALTLTDILQGLLDSAVITASDRIIINNLINEKI